MGETANEAPVLPQRGMYGAWAILLSSYPQLYAELMLYYQQDPAAGR